MTWLFRRVASQKSGNPNPRQADAPSRIVLHTTETRSTIDELAGQLEWPYHVLVDIKRRDVAQLISLDNTAYALRATWPHNNQPLGFQTNHMGRHCAQVAIVGTMANEMHLLNADDLRWFAAAVMAPIMHATGVPNEWVEMVGTETGQILASTSSPYRMKLRSGDPDEPDWETLHGVCGHQHVPGQDHWDPGNLDEAALRLTIIDEALAPPTGGNSVIAHVVAKGETLWGIAMRYGSTVAAIATENRLPPPYELSVGQRLRIPITAPEPVPEPDPKPPLIDKEALLLATAAKLEAASTSIDQAKQILAEATPAQKPAAP